MGTRCNVIFYDSRMTTKDTVKKLLDGNIKNTPKHRYFSILYRHYDGYSVGDDIRENGFFEYYNKRFYKKYQIGGSLLTHMVSSFQKWSFDNMKKRKMDRFLETFNVKNIWDFRKNIKDMPVSQIGELSSAIYDLTYDWNKMGHYEITTCIHGDIEYLWWIDIHSEGVEGYRKKYIQFSEPTWEKVEEIENE